MPRDRFISDNLINIRESLRQNYESKNPQSPEVPDSQAPEIHLDLKSPIIQSQVSNSRSADREYNEFVGRIQHDLAAVASEIQDTEEKNAALNKFNGKLQDIASALQELDIENSQDFFREFDRLRIVYFQSSGETAVFRNTQGTEVHIPVQTESTKPRRDYLLPAAILIAAVIISVTLMMLF